MYASEQRPGGYAGQWTGQQPGNGSAQRDDRSAYRASSASDSWASTSLRSAASDGYPGYSGYSSGLHDMPVAPYARSHASTAAVAGELFNRRGLLGWWLRLTAPRWPRELPPIDERERLRKAELTGLSILTVVLLLATLLSASLDRPQTAISAAAGGMALIFAAVLNRAGWTRTAAYLVPTILMAVVVSGIVWQDGGLQLATVPAYDLFVLPIFLTSLIGDRRAPWAFATLAMAFIFCDVLLQPHALITSGSATAFDDVQYAMDVRGWWGLVSGPLALAFFAALLGWLGALSVESAITRADRAEEIAVLEHQAAQQRRQLEHGVRQILQTHVRVANGDFTARAPLGHDNVLWQIGSSLNTLIARMQRSAHAEQSLARTEAELRRVAAALDDAEAGKQPRWPSPSGTPADLVLVRVARHAVREPYTPILSFESDGGSQPSPEPIADLAVGWRASSLIDLDAFPFGQTAPPEAWLSQGPVGQGLARRRSQAPAPSWAVPDATLPPVAAAASSTSSSSRPLPTPQRGPNTQPGARKSFTGKLPTAERPTTSPGNDSKPLQPTLQATSQAPAEPALVSDGLQVLGVLDPDLWPNWLEVSGAVPAAMPELGQAGTSAQTAQGTSGVATELSGEVRTAATGTQGQPRQPRQPGQPANPLFATAVPDQSLADAGARVSWGSETHRRRAQFLGPVPNPPWMEPNGQ